MNHLAIFATLLAVCATTEAMPKATQLQNAVDFWGPATPQQLRCLKDSGYAKVILCAFDIHNGDGQLDKFVLENTHYAQQVQLDVEYYMLPLIPSQKSGAEQFEVVYDGLARGGFNMTFIWIQVINKDYFHRRQTENVALISDMVAAAKQHNVGIGFYTTAQDYAEITGGVNFDNVQLWYVHTKPIGHPTSPDFDDFKPFAGFMTPRMKQYSQSEWICDALVDRNVYRDEPRNN